MRSAATQLPELGAVPDVDRERDEGEPRSDPRAERREEEQAKSSDSAEQVDLPPEQAVHHSREHTEHGSAEVSTRAGRSVNPLERCLRLVTLKRPCPLQPSLPRLGDFPAASSWSMPTRSSG